MSEEIQLSKFQIWLLAIRPKTLPAAVSPVLVGTAMAIRDDAFLFLPAIAAILGSLLIQILSNLANDYYDYLKGYDTEERKGPTRVAASGLVSLKELKNGIIINILLAMIIGLYLIYVGGLVILLIGVFSLIFAVLYSGGPFPLSTIGLGDLFVFIFFGLAAVGGTYYVQAKAISLLVFLSAVPPGLLITAILVVNNYRDIETDKEVGKFTLAVLMGHTLSKYYYLLLLIVSFAIPLLFFLEYDFSGWIFLPLLSIIKAVPLVKNIWKSNEGKIMNMTLAGTAQLSMIYSLLFFIGIVI
ncbi:MAG: 1,4-dihydroxy-2-naphthoate polyprenyltransferase [Candidatus Heimdallarchaeota archaeon]|nr:1,4-dihydroxy-2-naphthoate polyprenyltransferase [Candidatus Heimdallarchaeota archaeon]